LCHTTINLPSGNSATDAVSLRGLSGPERAM
jgi:hypothetical protein